MGPTMKKRIRGTWINDQLLVTRYDYEHVLIHADQYCSVHKCFVSFFARYFNCLLFISRALILLLRK